ncbi:MAG: SMP-30/gluconolactonase/LRE family protein [Deltaproteobacteria bacterium]|nr:SMP-30/gluconolactonase/LRE family protein [Deltaproteobacteria bacterium]
MSSTASGFRLNEVIMRFWYRHTPQLFLSELLEKRWMEPIIPFTMLCLVFLTSILFIPGYMSIVQQQILMQEFADLGLVTIAMAVTIMSGGIDLSVGAVFALGCFLAIYLHLVLGLPLLVVFISELVLGALLGMVNGGLIAYAKTRPFLTTIVTLIIGRAVYTKLVTTSASAFADVAGREGGAVWDFLGSGAILGVPTNMVILIVVGVGFHFYLTRLRPGVHIMAVGSSRKAARHAGINDKCAIFFAYVISSMLATLAGMLFACQQNNAGVQVGDGWEINALAGAVLGGISLSGGRGTMARALIGGLIVYIVLNGLTNIGLLGGMIKGAAGLLLLIAVGLDVKWFKNKSKALQKIYVTPSWVDFQKAPSIARVSGSPYAENDRLLNAEALGFDQIEGPEDIILDCQDNLYGVDRRGHIMRFQPPDYNVGKVFARIGGRPLGMTLDRDENLLVCVAGMGVYGVKPDRTVFKVTDETNRTRFRLKDDSRILLADDLDIAPDGKIYFSDPSIRYPLEEWALDGFEGRGNGRVICHDPGTGKTKTILRNLNFTNGICLSHDGNSILIASTYGCRIYRYWIATGRAGTLEVLIDNLPGYPDNINRASDGRYWLALVGLRAPAYDIAMAAPSFRRRMVKQIPSDEWLIPGINYGCIVKFDDQGKVIESLWDPSADSHPTITSIREHKGYLYIGGLENNRIGRVRLPNADPDWTGWESYWGQKRQY